jgi:enoyl-[acyl-carrier protein] reductase II
MSTVESPVHERAKRLAVETDSDGTVYSDRFDGQPCRVMRSAAASRAIRHGLSLTRAAFASREVAATMQVSHLKLALGVLASGWRNTKQLAHLATAFRAFRLATEEGDEARGVLPLGQATGLVHDLPTVREVIERIVAEAVAAQAALAAKVA